ncbi:MAG: methionine--tRNA ligase subunit beta [Candidatus Omnitrophica bacterium]|nr:methionine--tRNA ligase subunit beta [Candidatus Omnitrophota bacterium]
MVTIEDFKKLELKVAKIIDVKDHPQADRLYVLTIDCGGQIKQIVAGIKNSYSKESLLGRQIVIVDNLEPAILRGVESQGMLLATSDEKGISLIAPDRQVALGSKVK